MGLNVPPVSLVASPPATVCRTTPVRRAPVGTNVGLPADIRLPIPIAVVLRLNVARPEFPTDTARRAIFMPRWYDVHSYRHYLYAATYHFHWFNKRNLDCLLFSLPFPRCPTPRIRLRTRLPQRAAANTGGLSLFRVITFLLSP